MNTGKFLTIPADEYHAASRSGQYMSSHLLADFRSHLKIIGCSSAEKIFITFLLTSMQTLSMKKAENGGI